MEIAIGVLAVLVIVLYIAGYSMKRKKNQFKAELDATAAVLETHIEALNKANESNAELLAQMEAQNKDREGLVNMLEKSREIIQKLNDSLKDTTDSMVSSDKAIADLKELLNSDREYIVMLEDKYKALKEKHLRFNRAAKAAAKKPKAKKRK